jgi:hypothetical protein
MHRRLEAFAAKCNAIASMQTTTAFSCPECCAQQGQPHEPTCPTLQAPAEPAIGSWHTGLPLPDVAGEPAAPAPLIYPPELTPALAHILGFPNFRTGPIAHVFQQAGFKIATKCEAEQAFVLDRLIRAVLTHGEGWADAFSADLRTQQAVIATRKDDR